LGESDKSASEILPVKPHFVGSSSMLDEILASSQGKKPQDSKVQPVGDTAPRPQDSLVSTALSSLAYEAIQQPLKGVAQIADSFDKKNVSDSWQQKVTFMQAPQQAEFGSANWYAQSFGGAAGKLVPFLAALAVTKKGFGAAGAHAGAEIAEQKAVSLFSRKGALAIGETGAAGFLTESVLTPTERNQHNQDSSLLSERVKQGAVGAITFSTLTASSLGIKELGRVGITQSAMVNRFLTTEAGSMAMAGLPTGVIAAETHARIMEGRASTGQEKFESAYSMFVIGGGLGLAQSKAPRLRDFSSPLKKFDSFMADLNPLLNNGPRLALAGDAMGAIRPQIDARIESSASQSTQTEWVNRHGTVTDIEGTARPKPDKRVAQRENLDSRTEAQKPSTVLSEHGLSDIAEFVDSNRILRNQKVKSFLGQGNDSPAVLELAPSKEFPNGGALKVTIAEGGFDPSWGKRPFDAKLLSKVHEVDLRGGGSADVYVQELVDIQSRIPEHLLNDLFAKVEKAGMELTDVGSEAAKQFGISRATGELVLIDYPAIEKAGTQSTHQEIVGGRQFADEAIEKENAQIKAGEKPEDPGAEDLGAVDIEFEIKRAQALAENKFTPQEKELLDQLNNGCTEREVREFAAIINGHYDAKGNADVKAVKNQMDALFKRARAQGLIQNSGGRGSKNSNRSQQDYDEDSDF